MANDVPLSRVPSNFAWEVRQRALGVAGGLAASTEGVAIDARRIYVTSYSYKPPQPTVGQGARLVVLDADTLETLVERAVSGTPRAIAVSRNRIYVAGVGQNGSGLAQFDASSFASLAQLQLSGPPRRVVYSAAGSRLYMTVAGTLLAIDDTTGVVIATVNVGQGATGVAVDGDRIFVTLCNPSSVPEQNALVVLDAGAHAVLQSVPIAPVASSPQDVAVLPAVKRIFVANAGSMSQSPRLTVLSRDNLALIGEISLPGAPANLAVDVQRNRVYAATQAGLVVVDGAQNRTLTVLGPGRAARGVGFSQRTGQLVWGDPVDGVASSAVQPGESPFDLQLLRPDDLLTLDYTFHNLKLITDGSPRLVRAVDRQPAFVAVYLPSQSIAEETTKTTDNVRLPAAAVLAGRSRLVFRLPTALRELPFTAEGLLNWIGLEPSLAPAALPSGAAPPTPRPGPTQPLDTHTAIELPYRLTLSPDATAGWEHSTRPVVHGGLVELWHTRLRGSDGVDPAVRAIWTPDLVQATPHRYALALDAHTRTIIVRETSDWTLVDGSPPYTPAPAEADELMLSALGGFLRLRGAWNPPPGLGVTLWRQTTTLGRDHKVTAVSRGVLFPWGHRAVKVELTEREITTSADGPVAALRKRTIIVVSEADKSYVAEPFKHAGREMPFAGGVRLLTTVTPELDSTEKVAEAKTGPAAEAEPAFWIRTRDGLFEFDVSARDPAGRRATFKAQLIWVPETVLRNKTELDKVGAAYQKDDRRSVPISGQPIALAATIGAGSVGSAAALTAAVKDISLTTERLVFGLQRRELPDGVPAFLPRLERATVRIPAAEQM
ncbi:MAG TPA: YncE family protein, partial [Solirubrobacteraceae bacterium]